MGRKKAKAAPGKRLFKDPSGQTDLFEKSLEEGMEAKRNAPVECLGMTFENDDARRAYFTEKLREKLKDPEFRKIEGFPIGDDEDILRLSDPPYYTACPSPFLVDFVRHSGGPDDEEPDEYHREPFAADVSEGKNDTVYNAHSYHTKVPHKAVMRYILHYTAPGHIVLDGFCGTGMTGVAAQFCGDRDAVETLGYEVRQDGTIVTPDGQPFSKLGLRTAILNDLSPAASFIAFNYNTPVDLERFEREAQRITRELHDACAWMYVTLHDPKEQHIQAAKRLFASSDSRASLLSSDLPLGRIIYTVWSDVFVCPECSGDIVLWEVAVSKKSRKVRDVFACTHCKALLTLQR